MSATRFAWDQARHVLAIRLDAMGDVLMCTPAMRAIKESCTRRALTLLTSASGAAAANHVPYLDAVMEYAAPWMKCAHDRGLPHDLRMIEALRAERFDAAVIFTCYSQSALPAAMLCRMAGIAPILAHCREQAYHLISHPVPDPEPQSMVRHEVQRQLDLVASVGWQTADSRLAFHIPRDAREQVHAILARHDVPLQGGSAPPFILLHPGASAPSRRYPSVRWSEVAEGLYERYRCPIIVCAGQNEQAIAHAIARQSRARVINLAGTLTLGQLGALIGMAKVMLANNSGPAHLAAAIGTPIVCLYALTNPQHTPWQVACRVLHHDVPCRLCYRSICPQGHHDCLSKVQPAQVISAVGELLAERHNVRADSSPPLG